MEPCVVRAAGAVVVRKGGEVLLVHRPKYDDWSFPKGKLDPGEHLVTAAVREVAEETGLDVRLGPGLGLQRYLLADGRTKTVAYWVARVQGDDDVSRYQPNAEIDRVEWVSWDLAVRMLTYDYDRETLGQARGLRSKTRAIVVLRHGTARSRNAWKGEDRLRTLRQPGHAQAQRLIPLLAAFDATAIHTSSSTRCLDTVTPFGHVTGWPVVQHDILSEEDATADGILELIDEVVDADEGAVVCTHRPVLPTVLDALGVEADPLEPGAMLVVHHRKGRVVATETHQP